MVNKLNSEIQALFDTGRRYKHIVQLDARNMSRKSLKMRESMDGYHFMSALNLAKASTVVQLMDIMRGPELRFETTFDASTSEHDRLTADLNCKVCQQ